MRINIKNIKNFFKKNGKNWVCTSIATLMLGLPVMAECESQKNETTNSISYESIDKSNIIDLSIENNDGEQRINASLNDVDSIVNELKEIISEEDINNIQSSLTFKFYDRWNKNLFGNYEEYERSIYTISVNSEYFIDHNFEKLLEEIRAGKMKEKINILNVEKEKVNEKPNDYDDLSLELIGTNIVLKIKNSRFKDIDFIILAPFVVLIVIFGIKTIHDMAKYMVK